MKMLYYQLIKKVLKDFNNDNISICLFDDRKQTLNKYPGLDCRYLTMANSLFIELKKPWLKLKLLVSFRVPKNVCNFLNNSFYKKDFIYPYDLKNEEKIDYIIFDPFVIYLIKNLILEEIEKYGHENTFVSMNSTKVQNENNSFNKFFNFLSNEYHIYIKDDKTRGDKSLKHNKINITTFCSTKGRETDLVIVYGFDDYWFSRAKNSKEADDVRDKLISQ
ncbi:hypothetical protein [Spiroplasma gladiatoris]|nr:hypothetical protein [Spiroplasma gladiatoris]